MKIAYTIMLFLCLSSVPATSGDGNSEAYGRNSDKQKGKGNSYAHKQKGKGNSYARGREKHGAAIAAISSVISLDSGLPVDNYAHYSSNLANTLGQLDEVTLSRVLGENRGKLP